MTHQARGTAKTNAITSSTANSRYKSSRICVTEAPNTFLIPISFVRCSVVNEASPNNPKHATKIASVVNSPNTCPNFWSALYCRKEFEEGVRHDPSQSVVPPKSWEQYSLTKFGNEKVKLHFYAWDFQEKIFRFRKRPQPKFFCVYNAFYLKTVEKISGTVFIT